MDTFDLIVRIVGVMCCLFQIVIVFVGVAAILGMLGLRMDDDSTYGWEDWANDRGRFGGHPDPFDLNRRKS